MPADAKVTLVWFDGEDDFRLGLGEVRALQEKVGAGPDTMRRRLLSGDWYVDDIRETLRLALIGAGAKPDVALAKVKRCVDQRPLAENVVMAAAILGAAIVGVPDDPVGKASAEETETEATGALSSPPSTEQEQP
mgnify:CR=1 FL=1